MHPATKGDIRVLRLEVFFDLVILFYFFFHRIFTKRNQPLNIRCRSSWNSCQAWLQLPFVKARNNRVQRLFWWWQVHWQYPSAWAVHITAWKTAGCFLCLFVLIQQNMSTFSVLDCGSVTIAQRFIVTVDDFHSSFFFPFSDHITIQKHFSMHITDWTYHSSMAHCVQCKK